MRLRTPCLTCGEPTRGSRCEDCSKSSENMRIRKHTTKKQTSKERGYDSRWKRLSKRARELQPFYEICGTTEDLQGDHLPIAWERHEKGLPIRLSDIRVLCGYHNREAGAARGQHARSDSKPRNLTSGTEGHGRADRLSGGHTDPGWRPLAGRRGAPPMAQLFPQIDKEK